MVWIGLNLPVSQKPELTQVVMDLRKARTDTVSLLLSQASKIPARKDSHLHSKHLRYKTRLAAT
jgi:hypothetical protein